MRAEIGPRLLTFWRFFSHRVGGRAALSVRDLLAWARFVAAAAPAVGLLPAYAHGAHLVLLDGVGLGLGMPAQVGPRP
jgi:midasin